MHISREQQLLLVKEAKLLIDENKGNVEVLERANALALVIFSILSNDGDANSLGFSLQEYAYDCLEASKGDTGAAVWVDEDSENLTTRLNNHHNHYGSGNGPDEYT